ncbi:MAG: prolyl oligopeptidase family serine peptidase [Verrucomicrobiales bacterium]|nr:prolyl oligopeptidase family serine peptidase [Verrucomicrobiales bacterium]
MRHLPHFSRPVLLAAALLAWNVPLTHGQDVKPDSPQQVHRFTAEVTRTVTLEYLLFLPKDHAADPARRWPLLLFLHGAGERGSDIWRVAVHGPPKIVRDRPDFPFIVVSPQCPTGRTWSNEELLALLDDVIARYPVDRARVYLTGLSMGGYGTWSLGLAHPERFAAIVPICGGGDPLKVLLPDPQMAQALRTLPVWAFHGAKDPVVKVGESERMVEALRKAGAQNVQLTVYPDAQHDSWTETYNDPNLYEWLLRHRREPAP